MKLLSYNFRSGTGRLESRLQARLPAPRILFVSIGLASALIGQQKTVQAQGSSTINYTKKDSTETIEIRNIAFEITGTNIPGRPASERLVLRKTAQSKQVLDEIGMEASTTIEAWVLGSDLKQKPLYAVTQSGPDGRMIEGEVLVFDRGVEEVDWWSVHKLGTGQHLFDTYVPLLKFSISREVQTLRYAGLEVPPDDTADARLKDPHVVGVLTYASAERVIREVLLTCDDPKQAQMMRSYADETRAMSVLEARSLRISFSQSYPSPPATVTVLIPILKDDLDPAHAQLPPRVHASTWKR
jgi:hypothetical protein